MPGERLRSLASASLSGIAAGLVAGGLARLAMRLIVLLRGETPELSLGGTIGILITFAAMGAALGMTYALVSRGFRRGPVAGWWALAGLGLLASVVFVTPLRQEVARGPQFVALFIPIGLLLGWMPAWLGKITAGHLPKTRSALASTGYALVAAPGFFFLVALPLLMVVGILQLVGVVPVPTE